MASDEYFEKKTDCFGYDKNANTCNCLKRLYCKTENCKFYKTKKQFDEDRKKYGYNPMVNHVHESRMQKAMGW